MNTNSKISPSVFPVPFDNATYHRPIPVPVFRHIGYPISNVTYIRDFYGDITDVIIKRTIWTYYLGFIISFERYTELWVDFLAILVMCYFFMYFYSATYELDMSLNTVETIKVSLNEIEDEAEETVRKSINESRRGSLEESKRMEKDDEADQHRIELEESFVINGKKRSSLYEAQKYTDKIKSKMLLVKFYEGLSNFICATSSIISLVCLLMIAFQIEGLINLFYICFCLWYLSRAANFVFQKNWSFPRYLLKILKPAVILELMLQFAFQVPFSQLHGESDSGGKNWQKIIGLVYIWGVDDDMVLYYQNTSNLILK